MPFEIRYHVVFSAHPSDVGASDTVKGAALSWAETESPLAKKDASASK